MNLAGDGFPVYFISLEMSRYAVMRRLLKMKFGTAAVEYPNSKQLSALFEYEKELRQLPFYLNDSSSLEIEELISRARMRIARSGIRLVIVDYIQLIRFEGKDRRERVSECTDRLRRLAKDTGVPVMALSQLRRSQNVNDRPTMIDLKESGDIEAHAHVILLLYMPVGQDGAFTGEDELIVGKQREGPTGKVPIAFLGTKCQFYERETHV
jgi:replicative DNA helicase